LKKFWSKNLVTLSLCQNIDVPKKYIGLAGPCVAFCYFFNGVHVCLYSLYVSFMSQVVSFVFLLIYNYNILYRFQGGGGRLRFFVSHSLSPPNISHGWLKARLLELRWAQGSPIPPVSLSSDDNMMNITDQKDCSLPLYTLAITWDDETYVLTWDNKTHMRQKGKLGFSPPEASSLVLLCRCT
jgi:hypothetical protein